MQFPPEAFLIKMQINKETEKQYNELGKRFKLPQFREIDFELEISDFEETNFLLRAVMRRICEKLDFYCAMLEELLQPDTSKLYAMHETRVFDENEKKQMYELYAKLMSFNRQSIQVSLERNEKEDVDFINNAFNDWKDIRQEILKFVRKMKDSWNMEEADIKEDLRYLG